MSAGLLVLVPVLLLVVVVVVWVPAAYNGLVRLRNEVANASGQIDTQLVRRHDLVPSLLSAVQGYLQHERDVLDRVTRARAAAVGALGSPGGLVGRVATENELSSALGSLTAVVESYPQLRSSANVLRLQEDLVSTENRIAFARQHHNDAVTAYNTARETFPRNLLVGSFGFRPAEYLKLDLSVSDSR